MVGVEYIASDEKNIYYYMYQSGYSIFSVKEGKTATTKEEQQRTNCRETADRKSKSKEKIKSGKIPK